MVKVQIIADIVAAVSKLVYTINILLLCLPDTLFESA